MKKDIKANDFGITVEQFLSWRIPRFGKSNPSRFDNNVWEWLVKTRNSAYRAMEEMQGPSPIEEGPTWCFDRMGQTTTNLPDGRIVYIGGEHEDHYDPDFYIYNDVVVVNPDQSVEIYGYPKDTFPPTDFHSATLVDDNIYIIGSLGYQDSRIVNQTQVYILDINSFVISIFETISESPGWIHDHVTELSSDESFLSITLGKLDVGDECSLIENIDDWKLNIEDKSWERLTNRQWTRWEVKRRDKKFNQLWELRQALWRLENNWENSYQKDMRTLTKSLGKTPDLLLVNELYKPNHTHKALPENEEEYGIYRISIDDVVVRYVEEFHCVQVTVEGELPENIINLLKDDLLTKVSLLENTKYELTVI